MNQLNTVKELIEAAATVGYPKDIRDLIKASMGGAFDKNRTFNHEQAVNLIATGTIQDLRDFYHYFSSDRGDIQRFWDFCAGIEAVSAGRFGEEFLHLVLTEKYVPET